MKRITMIRPVTSLAVLALATGLTAQTPTPAAATPAATPASTPAPSATGSKVAVIEIQAAIFQTKDGQKALADLQAKFNPVKQKLEAKRGDITKDEDTLRKGSLLSDDAKQKLARDIDIATKALNRDTDDANQDLEQENQKLMNQLGGKMMAIINKYATDKGYLLVLDVSAQNTPVLWASNAIDITRDVIAAYDSGAAGIEPMPSRNTAPSGSTTPRRPATSPTTKQ